MQDARDSFYVALRDAVAAANPARTIVVRGQVRPGVLVEENELVTAEEVDDAFVLRWGAVTATPEADITVAKLLCQILYGTRGAGALQAGVAAAGVMGRGRALAAMDRELLTALSAGTCEKRSFAAMSLTGALVASNGMATPATAPANLGSKVWWSEPQFGTQTDANGRISKVASVSVWTILAR